MDEVAAPLSRLLQRIGRFALGQGAALAALAVVAAGLLGFAAVMQLVQGGSHRFDEAVLLALRRPDAPDQPIGPAWLSLSAREITALGSIPVLALLGLLALGYLLLDRRWRAALLLLVSLPGGLLLNSALKQGFDRPRPALVARLMEVQTASFPSGHAMLSAIGFLTLGALLASGVRLRRHRAYVLGAAVALTLLVGASRVWLGVHWPTDVLAGWCLGAAWAMGCWLVLRDWRRGS
ncbi:phosphatase PAP2 family protein [Dankookia sp. GCM10030260]|uniref:phosphatase PAP2 family protein n=1 Tax=Dankookia sp. GCM10030260 TaxID=3273390 RepID=UPI00361D770B